LLVALVFVESRPISLMEHKTSAFPLATRVFLFVSKFIREQHFKDMIAPAIREGHSHNNKAAFVAAAAAIKKCTQHPQQMEMLFANDAFCLRRDLDGSAARKLLLLAIHAKTRPDCTVRHKTDCRRTHFFPMHLFAHHAKYFSSQPAGISILILGGIYDALQFFHEFYNHQTV